MKERLSDEENRSQNARYEALFELLNQTLVHRDIPEVAKAFHVHLKYVANVYSWRYLSLEASNDALGSDAVFIIDGFRGEATVSKSSFQQLSNFERDSWRAGKPNFLEGAALLEQKNTLPKHFRNDDIVQLYVCPKWVAGQLEGLFFASVRGTPFGPFDLKFIASASLFFHDKVDYLRKEKKITDQLQAALEVQKAINDELLENRQALQDSARHTQAILDNVLDGIITIDRMGIISSFNRAAEKIFAYPSSEVIGRNFTMLMLQTDGNAPQAHPEKQAETALSTILGKASEVQGLRQDGSQFEMDLAVSRIVYKDQAMYIALVRDITERKKLETMKREFVATVSHELRTPLTAIVGSLGLLTGGALGTLPAGMKPMLDLAHKSSLHLSHLINDLLDMEKLEAGKIKIDFQIQPLMPLIDQCLESMHAYGEKFQVSFVIEERVEAVRVKVDSIRLQQVLANFLSNAAKFSPSGERVAVKISLQDNAVRVTVIDGGPGIPDEFRSRIFQKFSQADSSDVRLKGGTGLGLAITKELIERMNGRVGFDSCAGRGASFYFELPVESMA